MTETEYQLPEVYEIAFGKRGIDCYTHDELLERLVEMSDCFEWVCNFKNVKAMNKDLLELRAG